MKNKISEIFKKRSSLVIVLCLAVGILLIFFPTHTDESVKEEKVSFADAAAVESYTEKLEERIRVLCSAVKGAGNVRVLVTIESGSEYVYADNTSEEDHGEGGSSCTSDYIIVSNGGGETPVLVREIYPKVRGVAVVCDGGGSADICERITSLLSASLGISTNRIKVTS